MTNFMLLDLQWTNPAARPNLDEIRLGWKPNTTNLQRWMVEVNPLKSYSHDLVNIERKLARMIVLVKNYSKEREILI